LLTKTCISITSFRASDTFAELRRDGEGIVWPTSSRRNAASGRVRSSLRACLSASVDCDCHNNRVARCRPGYTLRDDALPRTPRDKLNVAILMHVLVRSAGVKVSQSPLDGATNGDLVSRIVPGRIVGQLLNPFPSPGLYPGLFMTQPTATPPGPASATFGSVAHPQRTGEYACGALGRQTPRLQDLEPSRDGRVMNKPGLRCLLSLPWAPATSGRPDSSARRCSMKPRY